MLHSGSCNAVPSHCRVSNVGSREQERRALCAVAQRSPLGDSGSQLLEYLLGIFPVNAGVCDGYTVLQAILALLRYLLVAYGFR